MMDSSLDPIEQLVAMTGSKFQLVTLAARRSRGIVDYFQHCGHNVDGLIPLLVYSSSRKPLSVALEEIHAAKIRAVSEGATLP